MRLIFILLYLVFACSLINGQDSFYYTPKGKVVLNNIDNGKVVVKFKNNLLSSSKNVILEKTSKNVFQKIAPDDKLKSGVIIHKEDKIYFEKKLQVKDVVKNIALLRNDSAVEYASPIYNYEDGTQFFFVDELVVFPKSNTPWYKVEELCIKYDVEIVKKTEYSENTYLLRLNNKNLGVVEISNLFFESGLFEFAEPNLKRILKRFDVNSTSVLPTAEEWHLRKTQTDKAWSKTAGSPTIKIAVIDDGVQLSHSELSGQLLPGYDCFGSTAGGSAYPSSHGTNCAGLIVANANNTCGTGVAYNCKVVPVRVGVDAWDPLYSEFYSEWASDGDVATAIRWAFGAGGQAKILSCSWGGGPYSSVIDNAFNDAVRSGCLVFCASGNENTGTVSFPASLPQVIAVGATNESDKRASSDDWGEGQGSNWGNDIDIVAPGNNIYTIDYNGCKSDFGGTSAATPIAAGVMGLLLSKYPQITASSARYILESTCDKITGYEYTGSKSSGSWNSEVGYGRINALKALTAEVPVNPPYTDCAVANFTQSNYNNENVCSIIAPGESVSFISTSTTNAAGGGIISYQWQFGDGTTSDEKNPSHTYLNEGNYPVSLFITVKHNYGSCQDQTIKSNAVIVSQQLKTNVAHNFSWSPTDDKRSFAYIGDNLGNCNDYSVWGDFVYPSSYGIFNNTLDDCTEELRYPLCKYKYNRLDQNGNYNWLPINKCVPGEWHASHGAPRYTAGYNPDGSSIGRSMQLISGRGRRVTFAPSDPYRTVIEDYTLNQGEGMYYNLAKCLNPSQVYKLRMTAKSTSISDCGGAIIPDVSDKLNISLANGLQPQEYGASSTNMPSLYQMPSYSFTEYKVGNVNTAIDENWRCIEIYFIPPADGNLNQLWIYPEGTALPRIMDLNYISTSDGSFVRAGHYQDNLQIDNLVLSTLGNNCISEITYDNNSNLPSVTSTSSQIIAQNNVKVLSGQDVKFEASKRIVLKPGFQANNGSNFNAVIKECESDYNYADFLKQASINNFSIQNDSLKDKKIIPEPKINYPEVNIKEEFAWNLRPEDENLFENNENEKSGDLTEQSLSNIKVYPNPNHGIFSIDLAGINTVVQIEIFNLDGKFIAKEYVNQRELIEFNLTEYPTGIYFVKIVTKAKVFTVKLFKN